LINLKKNNRIIKILKRKKMIREEDLNRDILRKSSTTLYISMYTEIYLEELAETDKMSIGKILDSLIRNQQDFKEVLSKRVERYKSF